MKVNLEKELKQETVAHNEQLEKFSGISEMKQLLEHSAGKEREVLGIFGLDENIKKVEAMTGRKIETEKFEKTYGNIYHKSRIESLAMDYRLRFLPLSAFKGGIDPLLATKIVQFCEEHKLEARNQQDSFYVLAPSEDFRLETELHRKPRPIVAQDPLLFYKAEDDRTGQYWTLVHKWGNEFNYFRLLKSWKYKNEVNYGWFQSIMWTSILMMVFTFLIGGASMPFLLTLACCSFLGFIIGMIQLGTMDDSAKANKFTDKNWTDSRYHKTVSWDF
jgi:hypothetical protein